MNKITNKQKQLIKKIGFSMTNKKLAESLKLNEKTVRNYKKEIFGYKVILLKDFHRSKIALQNITLPKTDWAYLAGIIDGEGSIFISRTKRKYGYDYSPYLSISNSNKKVLDWIKIKFNRGTITYDSLRVGKNYKRVFSYIKNGIGILRILEGVLPYLRIKKPQADLLIQYIEERLNQEWKNIAYTKRQIQIYYALKKLNKRGII